MLLDRFRLLEEKLNKEKKIIMKTYRYNERPLEIHGIPHFEERGQLQRLSDEVMEKLPNLNFLGRRCGGARICFRTNSTKIQVKMIFETLSLDVGLSIFNCQSACVYIGNRQNARFAGIMFPRNYEQKTVEETFNKNDEMEDIVIWFPRNEVMADFYISVEDDAIIEPPTPYKYPPMLYYGSSITECSSASKVSNGYAGMITQHLDVDHYNLGFSASAKGEIEIADYINTIPMSIFVFDYDWNAPTVEHLRATHEPFFRRIREKNPDLPIIMMSRPDFEYDVTSYERREVIKETFNNALAAGDKNVYFLDGETFFGTVDRTFCTNDCIHPTDIGLYRMTSVIEPLVKKILEERYGKK